MAATYAMAADRAARKSIDARLQATYVIGRPALGSNSSSA